MLDVPGATAVFGVLIGVLASAAPAVAKSYSAERLESVVRLLPDGALDVVETIAFRFDDGTFRQVSGRSRRAGPTASR